MAVYEYHGIEIVHYHSKLRVSEIFATTGMIYSLKSDDSRYNFFNKDLSQIINEKVPFYYFFDKTLHISLWNLNMSNNKTNLQF